MNVDSLLKRFDFDFYHYGVAYDEVQVSGLTRLLSGERNRSRYWIFRQTKVRYKETKDIEVFCTSEDAWGEVHYLFYKTTEVSDKRKIIYFNNLEEPVSLLESLKSKLDGETLSNHTLFNTKDLGW